MPISFLVDEDGKIPVTRSISLPLSYSEGLAIDKDGHLVITNTPSSIIFAGGIPRSPEGYLVVSGAGGGGDASSIGGATVIGSGTVFAVFIAVYDIPLISGQTRSEFGVINYV